jgi:hypothetical protein
MPQRRKAETVARVRIGAPVEQQGGYLAAVGRSGDHQRRRPLAVPRLQVRAGVQRRADLRRGTAGAQVDELLVGQGGESLETGKQRTGREQQGGVFFYRTWSCLPFHGVFMTLAAAPDDAEERCRERGRPARFVFCGAKRRPS